MAVVVLRVEPTVSGKMGVVGDAGMEASNEAFCGRAKKEGFWKYFCTRLGNEK